MAITIASGCSRNYLAQSEALLIGRKAIGDELPALAAQRSLPGNRPSTSILLDELLRARWVRCWRSTNTRRFARYVWQINPFDQWGVELGKVLSESVSMNSHPTPRQRTIRRRAV